MPDRTCSCCYDTEFDDKNARAHARDYARKGAPRATRLLADGLAADGAAGLTVLDIGAGVGAVHHALLDRGAVAAVDVDASGPYLAAARQEAERRGIVDRIRFEHGDFVELAEAIEAADLVALDRSVCCYPDMRRLVGLAAVRTRRRLGIVVPRELAIVRIAIGLLNVGQWLRRSAFRVHAHPHAAIDDVARDAGLRALPPRHTGIWTVLLYARQQQP